MFYRKWVSFPDASEKKNIPSLELSQLAAEKWEKSSQTHIVGPETSSLKRVGI